MVTKLEYELREQVAKFLENNDTLYESDIAFILTEYDGVIIGLHSWNDYLYISKKGKENLYHLEDSKLQEILLK